MNRRAQGLFFGYRMAGNIALPDFNHRSPPFSPVMAHFPGRYSGQRKKRPNWPLSLPIISVSKKSFRHAVRILKLSKSFKILLIERAVGFLPPAHTPRCSVASVFCGVFLQPERCLRSAELVEKGFGCFHIDPSSALRRWTGRFKFVTSTTFLQE